MMIDIPDLYQNNPDFKRFVDHWSSKNHRPASEVMNYEISRLYAEQLLTKEEEKQYEYQVRQDNGIS